MDTQDDVSEQTQIQTKKGANIMYVMHDMPSSNAVWDTQLIHDEPEFKLSPEFALLTMYTITMSESS